MNRNHLFLAVVMAMACVPVTVHAAQVTLINKDVGTGQGLDDRTPVEPIGGNPGTTRGEQAMNVFRLAADLWGATLESDVEIRASVSFQKLQCTATRGTLGSAGPNFAFTFEGSDRPEGTVEGTWYASALADALAGTDLVTARKVKSDDPDEPDLRARFNGSIGTPGCLNSSGWYLGVDGNAPSNRISLLDTVLHEMGHGLGFLGFDDVETGEHWQGNPGIYETFVIDNSTGQAWNDMTDAERKASTLNDGHVVFTGANVVAEAPLVLDVDDDGVLVGGDADGNILLYAPTEVETGSSFSHYDTRLTMDALMEPFATDELQSHVMLDLTPALFKDLGWGINRANQLLLTCDTGLPTSVAGGGVVGANVYGSARMFANASGSVEDYRTQIEGHVEGLRDDGLLTSAQFDSVMACLSDDATQAQYEEWGPEAGPDPGDAIALRNAVTLTGRNGETGSETLYSIEVPAGTKGPLSIMTSGGSGDVTLLVSFGEAPTAESAQYTSARTGNSETIRINVPAAGTYYIKVVGTRAYKDVRLQARF